MNTQNQINHCIKHLNETSDGIGMVEIQADGTALVYSLKNPTQYCTIYSIYTDEQIEIFQDRSIGEMIEAADNRAAEIVLEFDCSKDWQPEWDEN
jgi:hypothetical protein